MIDVTVIIPFYSGWKYLSCALNSISSQTLLPKKVVIINDQSPNSNELNFIQHDKYDFQVIILNNSVNSGPGVARNLGMKESASKYIAFLDEDDQWHPQKLEIQINFMVQNNIVISSTEAVFVNQSKNLLISKKFKVKKVKKINLILKNVVNTSTVIVSNELYSKLSFDKSMRYSEDFEFWLRATDFSPIFLIKLPLTFRLLRDDFSNLSFKLHDMYLGEIHAINKNFNSLIIKMFINTFLYLKYLRRIVILRLSQHKFNV